MWRSDERCKEEQQKLVLLQTKEAELQSECEEHAACRARAAGAEARADSADAHLKVLLAQQSRQEEQLRVLQASLASAQQEAAVNKREKEAVEAGRASTVAALQEQPASPLLRKRRWRCSDQLTDQSRRSAGGAAAAAQRQQWAAGWQPRGSGCGAYAARRVAEHQRGGSHSGLSQLTRNLRV